MSAELFIAGTAINVLGGIFGANKASRAAAAQAEAQNAAARRTLDYQTDMWDMKKEQLFSDRDHLVESIDIQASNEQRLAQHKDAVNLQKYQWDMMIRNREQVSLNQQYLRSNNIYNQQTTLNSISEQLAIENEYRKLQEIEDEAAFNAQDAYIEDLRNEGKIRARGMSGRSIGKLQQSSEADHGRQISMLNASIDSAGRNARAMIDEITLDKTSADLEALAQKMLDPGTLPSPIVPFATPMATFQYPRQLQEFDFGPQPVLGAMADPSAAASRVWGTAISGIAGNVGSGLVSWATKG